MNRYKLNQWINRISVRNLITLVTAGMGIVFVCGMLMPSLNIYGLLALSREELLHGVWGYDYMGETRTVDVHVQRLRRKIGMQYIETVYKYGYRFSTETGDEA